MEHIYFFNNVVQDRTHDSWTNLDEPRIQIRKAPLDLSMIADKPNII